MYFRVPIRSDLGPIYLDSAEGGAVPGKAAP